MGLPPTEEAAPRAVVDVNVTIRGVLSSVGASRVILDAVRDRRIRLVGSRPYFYELHRTLSRPRIAARLRITASHRRRLLARLYALALMVEPDGRLRMCRDPNDDYLIEMALLARASYLVSEDDLHDEAIIHVLSRHRIQLVRAADLVRLHLRSG